MKQTLILLSVFASISAITYFFVWCGTKKYDYPLNTIKAIKYYEPADKGYAYNAVRLTPTQYRRTPYTNTLVAKAIYKGDTIGIKIENKRSEIIFHSIGKESDNFLKAIAELYDENATQNTTMRQEIKCDYSWNAVFVNWHFFENYTKLVATALNGKDAQMYLDIMIPTEHAITIGDKNRGLSKKRFVDVFRENVK